MQRTLEYILLFVTVVLLQTLLFNNLLLTRYVVPLYYVVFMLLLPVSTGRMSLLLWGALLGLVMDILMGTAGLNVIATTAVGFLRPSIMNITMGKDVQHENIPFGGAIEDHSFAAYATILVGIHGLLFFGFESLGSHLLFTLVKLVLSTVVTVALAWITAAYCRKVIK